MRSILAQWDLDQAYLARWLDVTPTTISRLMTGQRPWTLAYLERIAGILGVTVSELTGPTPRLLSKLPSVLPRRDSNLEPAD